MRSKPACLILVLLLGGCALNRPPLACRGALQPINAQAVEKSRGPA